MGEHCEGDPRPLHLLPAARSHPPAHPPRMPISAEGYDLRAAIGDAGAVANLRADMERHKLLVFRGQTELSGEDRGRAGGGQRGRLPARCHLLLLFARRFLPNKSGRFLYRDLLMFEPWLKVAPERGEPILKTRGAPEHPPRTSDSVLPRTTSP